MSVVVFFVFIASFFLKGEICVVGSWENKQTVLLKNTLSKRCPGLCPKIRIPFFQEKD